MKLPIEHSITRDYRTNLIYIHVLQHSSMFADDQFVYDFSNSSIDNLPCVHHIIFFHHQIDRFLVITTSV